MIDNFAFALAAISFQHVFLQLQTVMNQISQMYVVVHALTGVSRENKVGQE